MSREETLVTIAFVQQKIEEDKKAAAEMERKSKSKRGRR